ncbi:MAG TPA: GTP-binding protein [Turneriella sp.]|nr:GTP-binding protein [Turneriella sp.]HNJ65980.1 GTP-binding protein [Turneriella sp.]HNL11998.1 GTP-binding protein [Turneriella sp.]HNL53769.1 GTP-binding protein [Turneriella sp.]HNM98892.1 GTP-binding protein [Turneriella sp.]
MDLLRVFTCGSVDDGKSTLIGRLLYDAKSIFQEHLDHIESKDRVGDGELNLALLTDGLKAEREQGITIDVAYKYFSTPKRKFIIADTPGHVQYTRNMVTGASLADTAIILIDARQGILEQTRRHSFISHLLRVPHLVVCVNKMDLVGFSAERFAEIETEFKKMSAELSFKQTTLIPISALKGDNIVNPSAAMPWYKGKPLLTTLEESDVHRKNAEGTRFTVQYVLRPQSTDLHDFRGFAGVLRSGTLRKGDKIRVEPSGEEASITALHYSGKPADEIYADDSAVVELDRDIDISRGDIFTHTGEQTPKGSLYKVYLTHLDTTPLKLNYAYYLQTGTRKVKAMVKSIESKLDIHSLKFAAADGSVGLNEIAEVTLKTAQPVVFDTYAQNWTTGAGVLVDAQTHMTACAVMNAGSAE